MKKTIKKLMVAVLMSCLSVSVFASIDFLGTFKKDAPIDLIQVCATCTWVNITSVTAPNSTLILKDVQMIKDGSKYTYSLEAQEKLGIYNICGMGDLDGDKTVWCYTFEVTSTGYKPTTAQGIIYFVLLFISLVIFVLVLLISVNLDTSRYERDTISGKVIAINWKRYYRVFCYGIAYGLLVWIVHLGRSIAEIFLESAFLAAFFKMLFYILLSLMWPLIALIFYLLVASWIVDIKNRRLIKRGLSPR